MITGEMLIGGTTRKGSARIFHAVDPATGQALEPAFGMATTADVEDACQRAWQAFDAYRRLPYAQRADLLDGIASEIGKLGPELIDRCAAETGLPKARIEGERARTVGQLALFAQVVRDGLFLDARVDPARPERKPMPRVDLRSRRIPLGPVAVFGSSNFPLAFSVAGGDTASALAAGCPVVVKAHSAHPGTSELIGRAIAAAARQAGVPDGVFSLLYGDGRVVGTALVADPRIRAVGFTGSRQGGLALAGVAQGRPEPIPVYAEMSSINPVILLPHALAERSAAIAKGFVASLTLGAGQFCTNPGLILALDDHNLDRFIEETGTVLGGTGAATMLTDGILAAYGKGVEALAGNAAVTTLARGQEAAFGQCQAGLFATTADAFLRDMALREEVFGPTSLVVRCPDEAALFAVLESLEGQLTAAIHATDSDHPLAARLLPVLERKVGRILFNGFGTGVEVTHAMVHGGPFPSTTDSRTTSVGTMAIERFLRPVCYQDVPDDLLPEELRAAEGTSRGASSVPRMVDGKRQAA